FFLPLLHFPYFRLLFVFSSFLLIPLFHFPTLPPIHCSYPLPLPLSPLFHCSHSSTLQHVPPIPPLQQLLMPPTPLLLPHHSPTGSDPTLISAISYFTLRCGSHPDQGVREHASKAYAAMLRSGLACCFLHLALTV